MARKSILIALAAAIFSIPAVSIANDPVALNDYAVQLLDRGDVERAVENLQKAFRLYPYNETLRKNLAEAYAASGHTLMDSRDFDAAAERYDLARELFPESAKFLMMRGVALYWAKNLDLARIELEKAAALQQNSDILYYLGQVYYDTGEISGALQKWQQALELKQGDKTLTALVSKATKELALEPAMEKGGSSRFAVTFDVTVKSDIVTKVLEELETAYNRVGSDLAYYPTAQVPVILYTRKNFKAVTDSPEWSGGLYDGKIRIPIGGLTEITPQFRAVLVHEYTHAAIHGITKGNCPTWINEGLAEYEGRKEFDPPLMVLPKRVMAGNIAPLADFEGSFIKLSTAEASLAYEASYEAVRFMISSYGLHKVKDLLTQLGTGQPVSSAFTAAFADYQLTYPQVESEWHQSLRGQYPKP